MKVLIDNGHGIETKGNRSPDSSVIEYEYCRKIANKVVEGLRKHNIDADLLVSENNDIPLVERVKRCNIFNPKETILISIHINAAGNGKSWMNARGWSVYVSDNSSSRSKILSDYLAQSAYECGLKVRKQYSDRPYWTNNFYILKYSKCPAVLTENLFMDNKDDVKFLLSEEGFDKLVELHINGILNYLKNN
jgi:N-acetylmuramoyl-L-alanine amidase